MDTGKNCAGKCSFSVMRVRAEVAVSSVRDAAERDEEKANADLARGMKELSLSGEKKDGSARVGCVSKGKLSEVQNKVPRALPAGSEASACFKYAVTGKNIITSVSVSAESKQLTDHYPSGATSWLEGIKQKVEIPLKNMFLYVLDSIGSTDPVFSISKFNDAFQVHIYSETDLPCCRLPSVKNPIISGDVCTSFELAEASAIKKSFEHLERMHSVVVDDLSTYKIRVLNITCREEYMRLLDAFSCVDKMLELWAESSDVLFGFEERTYSNLHVGGNMKIENLCGSFLGKVHKELDDIYRASVTNISTIGGQLKLLNGEKANYQSLSRSKPYKLKPYIVEGKLYEVDILRLLLQWMAFEEAEFITTTNENGLYLGAVSLTIPDTQSISKSGEVTIDAYCETSSLSDANNSAAREAILYLEREFNIEVVDYNYSEKLSVEEELSFLKDLNHRVRQLGATVKMSWGRIIDSLKCSLEATNGFAEKIKLMHGFDDKTQVIVYWVTQLQHAETKIGELFQIATKKYENLP